MINFEEVIAANRKLVISPDSENEVIGYYTKSHVDKDTVPDGWYIYGVRHNGKGNFSSIEKLVIVNYAGAFLSQKPLKLNRNGYYRLKSKDDYKFI